MFHFFRLVVSISLGHFVFYKFLLFIVLYQMKKITKLSRKRSFFNSDVSFVLGLFRSSERLLDDQNKSKNIDRIRNEI